MYSSSFLQAEHETTRSSATRRKIIVEAVVKAGYSEALLDKLVAGTLIKMHK